MGGRVPRGIRVAREEDCDTGQPQSEAPRERRSVQELQLPPSARCRSSCPRPPLLRYLRLVPKDVAAGAQDAMEHGDNGRLREVHGRE
jgi:hypothetical protein